MTSILSERLCYRCGIRYAPSSNTREEWREYCKDCRPEAQQLGWIPRHGDT